MKRGELYWADLGPPAGRRPVVIVTRNGALPVLNRVTVAFVTRTIRGIASEVSVGRTEGLQPESVVSCDNLATVSKAALDPDPVGRLGTPKTAALDRALRFALGIRF